MRKQEKEERWFEFWVDGKKIAVLKKCASTDNEIKRLGGLHGIEIKEVFGLNERKGAMK